MMHGRLARVSLALAVLLLIAALYWPVTHGGYFWDDHASLHNDAALRGAAWKNLLWRGFNGWVNYFRPLIVLMFAAQTRAFDVAPEPMHVVSLGLHLMNVILVGLLARALCRQEGRPAGFAVIAMAFYGLHPALIEPVAWVGCQFELALVGCILLGLLLNAVIVSPGWRAVTVAASFLLATGFKEAAVAFPPLLVLFDLAADRSPTWGDRLRATWRRQRGVYAAVVLAGVTYLALRWWALGYTVLASGSEPLLSVARLQRVCLTYLSYWKLVVWPMTGIGLIHDVDEHGFAVLTASSLAIDAVAIGLAAFGLIAFWRRRTLGTLITAVGVALLPVLNLLPIAFNESLYHDRYASTAVAMACVLLPGLVVSALARWRVARLVAPAVALVWLGFAIAILRITVPLWTDEAALWQWTLRQTPDSLTARSQLLTTYLARNDHARARELADALVAESAPCPACMLNAANLAISENDAARAAQALSKIKDSNVLAYNRGILHGYVFANGELLELQGDLSGAEEAYRDAITLDPLDPVSQVTLAMLLIKEGKLKEAKAAADIAIPLFAPAEREQKRVAFEQALTSAARPH